MPIPLIRLRLMGFVCFVAGCLRLAGEGIPDKIVVLTFDDSIKSHYSVVGPLLKQYGFGATFFITEGFDFKTDKEKYMTWEEIASLSRDGFEIGNHTRDHMGVTDKTLSRLEQQVEAINRQCALHGIPRPTSFAYPGNAIADGAPAALKALGFRFARRGGAPEHRYEHGKGFAYEPGLDHPLLLPSAGDSRPHWTLENFKEAVHQARFGKIAILQFHGVPDRAHAWVHTPRERFVEYMDYLAANEFTVIALRDLANYVDPDVAPNRAQEVIEDRQQSLAAGRGRDNVRMPASQTDLKYWLGNMVEDHGFDHWEVRAATGLDVATIDEAVRQMGLRRGKGSLPTNGIIQIRPYPGGRHPRIGFLDGAMRPQRETKFSVFAPWDDGGYAVVDVPEAIWVGQGKERELLYLAHTHVPTRWSKRGEELKPLEWKREREGVLSVERRLPNHVRFGARVEAKQGMAMIELWLHNGSEEHLTGLNLQNCVMLKALTGFEQRNNDNKVLSSPFAAVHNSAKNRWLITGWEACRRPWANANCPCLHADPKFPDCAPGERVSLNGLVAFYEGEDIEGAFERFKGSLAGER